MNPANDLTELRSEMEINPEETASSLINLIRSCMETLERDSLILGLSGGIDSSVMLSLCTRAVGPDKVLALIMPEKDSDKEHIKDALDLAGDLGVKTRMIDMTSYLEKLGVYDAMPFRSISIFKGLRKDLIKRAYSYYERKTDENPFSSSMLGMKDKKYKSLLEKGNAYYRVKHRLRMILLYFYAEQENRLVVGAANKSEYRIGFFVKHGCDDAADTMPILDLYKTQVRALASHLNIPARIIDKSPSPDILPGIIDEDAIGVPYDQLDMILLAQEKGWEDSRIAHALGVNEKKVLYVKSLVEKSEHMRR